MVRSGRELTCTEGIAGSEEGLLVRMLCMCIVGSGLMRLFCEDLQRVIDLIL